MCKYAAINIQHNNRINNLIPENKVSNKSKNPAPDFEERIAFLWFGRLERSRKVLLDRIYTYFTSMPGLIRLHYHSNITSQGRQDQARQATSEQGKQVSKATKHTRENKPTIPAKQKQAPGQIRTGTLAKQNSQGHKQTSKTKQGKYQGRYQTRYWYGTSQANQNSQQGSRKQRFHRDSTRTGTGTLPVNTTQQ